MLKGLARGQNTRRVDTINTTHNLEERRYEGNVRTTTLMNHMCKVLMVVLLERLKSQVEAYLAEEQAAFYEWLRHDTANIKPKIAIRKSQTKRQKCVQLFHRLWKSIRFHQAQHHMGNYEIIWSRKKTGKNASKSKWKCTVCSSSGKGNMRMVQNFIRNATKRRNKREKSKFWRHAHSGIYLF